MERIGGGVSEVFPTAARLKARKAAIPVANPDPKSAHVRIVRFMFF
jgi:hypothetical protein